MTATKQRQLQFEIQQLKMDKLIYSVSAIAICFAVFLLLLSLPVLFTYLPNLPPQTSLVFLGIAVGSVLLALVTNLGRCLKIRQLKQELSGD